MTGEMVVGGLLVPARVIQVAARQEWTAYVTEPRLDPAVVEQVFGEEPDSSWRFYSVDEIRAMTQDWHAETDPEWFGAAPNDIEPSRSVLIGELGYDRPFALDFRRSPPVVRLMTVDAQWRVVAVSASALLDALGIPGEG